MVSVEDEWLSCEGITASGLRDSETFGIDEVERFTGWLNPLMEVTVIAVEPDSPASREMEPTEVVRSKSGIVTVMFAS